MSAVIRLQGLTKQYGKKLVLKNLNLEIQKGELFGVIGMSGSGKTTLLNTLIGFLQPEEGDILYYSKKWNNYKSVFENEREVRKTFGFATQVPSFYPKLTIEENLDYFGSLYKLPKTVRKKNIDSLLKMIGMESEKGELAQKISGGMEKRLGIACSLVHNPDVLILDEPTANLDPVLRTHTWDLIKEIHRMGTTVIVASHLLEELEPVCDRVGILHNHSLIQIGTPDQLKGRYTKNQEIRFEVSGKQTQIVRSMRASVADIKKEGNSIIFYTGNSKKTLYRLLHVVDRLGENIIRLELSKPSLKEVFASIYYQ